MNRKQKYLFILFSGTVLIVTAMLFLDREITEPDIKGVAIDNQAEENPATGETINELLLSSNELSIGEKKSFINLYLKADDKPGDLAYEKIKTQRKLVYSDILRRKINNVKKPGNDNGDFFIRSVPK